MKSEHLIKMLDMLTSGYTRKDLQRAKEELPPITNIGKLFSLFAYHLDLIKEHVERIRLWDNLDNAQGRCSRFEQGSEYTGQRRDQCLTQIQ